MDYIDKEKLDKDTLALSKMDFNDLPSENEWLEINHRVCIINDFLRLGFLP